MTQDLLDTYKELFEETPWMGDESKANAIEKLETMNLNILEPTEGYFDYSKLDLTPTNKGGSLLGNYFKLKQYRYDCESKLINKPAAAGAVFYSKNPTVPNAFYAASSNSINIMPGFVSTLTYTNKMDDAELLSGIGGVVGHEISHGFDYCGAQYDANAEPNSIYTGDDLEAFIGKTKELTEYYNAIEVMPGLNVDGEYVIVEAAADLSGTQAILALMDKSENPDYERFFAHLSNLYARITTEDGLSLLLIDSHPLNNLRVNVNTQMFESVYDVLGISEGDGMYLAPEDRIVVFGPNA
jgi:putative endopeptidase